MKILFKYDIYAHPVSNFGACYVSMANFSYADIHYKSSFQHFLVSYF